MMDVSELPLAETIFEERDLGQVAERDRIVILARRAAGKTVYLSVLYEKYWKSLDHLTTKAVSGHVHSDLIRTVEGLRAGRWPPATLETQHCDLELSYKGHRYILVAMDYAGELFRKAFVEDVTDSPETEALVKHIDSAAAVMLVIDPAIASGDDVDAKIDDDFGMTQAVARIRNWPGGEDVPVVLVLTKADENAGLIASDGGLENFVARRFPALARTLGKTYIFKVAAVQAQVLPDGTNIPRSGFVPDRIEVPLLHCLDRLDLQRDVARDAALRRQRERAMRARLATERRAERRTTYKLIAIVVFMILLAACTIAYIWVTRS